MTRNEFAPFHVRLDLGEFETPLGFASRIAYANGFGPLRQFCSLLAFKANDIRRGKSETMRRLAGHAGVDVDKLRRFAFCVGQRKREAQFGAEEIKRSMWHKSEMRYCPHCVSLDIQNSIEIPAASAFMRAHWHLAFVQSCDLHDVALVTAKPRDELDFGQYVYTHQEDIAEACSEAQVSVCTAAERYFSDRVTGTSLSPCALDAIALTPAFELVDALGCLESNASMSKSELSVTERVSTRQAGFDIAKGGVSTIMSYLDNRARTVRRDRRSIYGDLARILNNRGNDPAFAELSKQVHEHAISTLGLGPRQRFIGYVQERKYHSVLSAATEHRLPAKVLLGKLVELGIVDPTAAQKKAGDVLFPVETTKNLLEKLSERVDVETAADFLGVGKSLLHQLSDEGLFRRIERKYMHARTMIRYYELVDFLAKVNATTELAPPKAEMVKIEAASILARCPISQIISLVLAGDVPAMRDNSEGRGLRSIMVDPTDVSYAVAHSVRLHKFDRAAVQSDAVAIALISAGFLKHPSGLGDAPVREFLHPSALAEFRLNLVPLNAVARMLELNETTAIATLDKTGIKPVVEAVVKPGRRAALSEHTYYRIRDVEALL